MEGQELQWNCKRNQSGPLGKLYSRYTLIHDIPGEFCPNAVSIVSNLVAAKFWKGGGV